MSGAGVEWFLTGESDTPGWFWGLGLVLRMVGRMVACWDMLLDPVCACFYYVVQAVFLQGLDGFS